MTFDMGDYLGPFIDRKAEISRWLADEAPGCEPIRIDVIDECTVRMTCFSHFTKTEAVFKSHNITPRTPPPFLNWRPPE
jgi:hypothetical protein